MLFYVVFVCYCCYYIDVVYFCYCFVLYIKSDAVCLFVLLLALFPSAEPVLLQRLLPLGLALPGPALLQITFQVRRELIV